MKNSLIITALLITTQCLAHHDSIPVRDSNLLNVFTTLELQKDASGMGFFELTQEATGTKDELYSIAKQWIFNTYKAGESVIKLDDKAAGVIMGKGYSGGLTYTNYGKETDAGGFFYRIELRFKDGRIKCKIDQITYEKGFMSLDSGADIAEEYPSNWMTLGKKKLKKEWNDMQAQGESNLKYVILSLVDFMTKPSEDKW